MRLSIIPIGLGLTLGATLVVGSVQAQTEDHLTCYQVKGDLKLKGLLDLTTPQFGLEEGCRITKPKFFCVPATKSNLDVVDGKTKEPITPLPFSAAPAPGDRICWKVKCPEPFPPDQLVTDQFGTQTLTRLKAKLLCTPAVKGTDFCGDGVITGSEACEPADDGACPGLCQPDCSCGVIPSTCGNGFIDGNDDCDGLDLGGATCQSLGLGDGTLACTLGCGLDVSGCTPFPCLFPATGLVSCWDPNGTLVACAGRGHDGEIQAGEALAYMDNLDGTITDLTTGLVWEKKSDDESIHDMDTSYTWDNAFAVHIATLNDPNAPFAGHTDWRLPNYKELVSILDLERISPSVDPVFNTACAPGCTVTSCSCTVPSPYWSSSSFAGIPPHAWLVEFLIGNVGSSDKGNGGFVRAVRGGL